MEEPSRFIRNFMNMGPAWIASRKSSWTGTDFQEAFESGTSWQYSRGFVKKSEVGTCLPVKLGLWGFLWCSWVRLLITCSPGWVLACKCKCSPWGEFIHSVRFVFWVFGSLFLPQIPKSEPRLRCLKATQSWFTTKNCSTINQVH